MKSILDLARKALSDRPAAGAKDAQPDNPTYEINELNEIPPKPIQAPLFSGWVRFRVHGWQMIIRGQTEWNSRANLDHYLAAMGEAVLDSILLPEGESP